MDMKSTNGRFTFFFLTLVAFGSVGAFGYSVDLRSPDGAVVVSFALKEVAGREGCMVYGVTYRRRPVLVDSPLGLAFDGAAPIEGGLEVRRESQSYHDSTYTLVYGERRRVRDHYREQVVELRETKKPFRTILITLRAYNEGAAFCYTIPEQDGMKDFVITQERTHFRFTGDHTAYAVYSAQGVYQKVPISKIKRNCERPLTVEIPGGPVVAVGEARLVDYARMRLAPAAGQPLTLVSQLGSTVKATAPLTTPWRVVLLGERPGDLLERNYLFLNLNDPCAIADTSWIKPGKVIREVSLSTAGGTACVDFAVEHNLQYVEYDAGWYGHEYSNESDARTVTLDPKRSKGPLDLHAVIEYARERGIGIIVYVNRRALERQLDQILPLYRRWGIKGVKYGFVNVGSQQWTAWLHDAVRKAAAHELMVDVHDAYRPTGYTRTYPNLMTQEGIRGNECMPAAGENLILPFTRMLCGAGDYTVCYYTNRIKTTHAHQLAASVVFYSPWQFLFWYDRPSAYRGEPEIEFFEHVPTVWDDTNVINGAIGQYITIARRSGEEWYVGSMTDHRARELSIPLTFLDRDRTYVAHIYSDGGSATKTRTRVKIERRTADAATVLTAAMPLSGGHAIRFVPVREE